ncbi:MAG TPA: DUF4235 domain-containing protein [Gaiellaceae bacterium]|nr:DUF4235 domain-containing protein [Gaiellaceae bacterium]
MARLIYKPFGLVVGVLGGLAARAVFKRVWSAAGHEDEAPKPTDEDKGWREVVLAAAAEGAVFGGVKALIDRAGASSFAWLTGAWPGRSKPE